MKRLFPVREKGANRVTLHGAFRPNGGGGIVSGSEKGVGYSVARVDAGRYRITFAESFQQFLGFKANIRVADATATIIQAGDYVAASRTIDVRVLQGGAAAGGVVKMVPFDLLNARVIGKQKVVNLDIGSFTLNGTPPTHDAQAGGLAFDADNEYAYNHFRVPDDWDGASNLVMTVVWHSQHGAAIGAGQTVIIDSDLHCVVAGEDVDAAVAQALTVTETFVAGLAEDIETRSNMTIAYAHATSPVAKGDTVWFTLRRDKSTDTYAGDVVVTRVEIRYNSFAAIPIAISGDGTGPYIRRINGAINAGFQLVWPAGCVDPVQLPPLIIPPDHNGGVDEYIKVLGLMAGAVDTPVITCGTYENDGTVINDNTSALGAAFAEDSATLAHGDFGTHPGTRNVILTPGAHNTDAIYLMGVSWEYTSLETGSTFALADLVADADNEIMFAATFRVGTVE